MDHSRRVFLQAASALPLVAAQSSTGPVSIDGGRQLFVDDHLIAVTTMHRTFHKPTIHPASPVIKPETPMELNGGVMPAAGPYSGGIWFDPSDRLYKAWYQAGYDDGFAYATSEDGLTWVRPDLDIVPGTNRILKPVPGYIRNGSTVWLDHEADDPRQRYKFFSYYRAGTGVWPRIQPEPVPQPVQMSHLRTSPDGIHWSEPALGGPCGDNSGMFYNPFRRTWVFNIRQRTRKVGRIRSYFETPRSQGYLNAKWKEEDIQPWMWCDELDRPDPELGYIPQLYKVDCVAYESRMIAFLGIFKGPPNSTAMVLHGFPKTNDLEVAFSRDGLSWDRPDRTPFLACSRQLGTWNRGYLHPVSGLFLVVGDELRIYFTGFSGVSPKQGTGPYAGQSTGLAKLRRDGFASMGGPGAPERGVEPRLPGVLTTRELTFSGRRLFVNAKLKVGQLRVAVLDPGGNPIEPFTLANCVPLAADSTKQEVTWTQGQGLQALTGSPVRLHFEMNSGELYSFWVSPDDSGASYGYVAAGGPGFTSATDTTGS